LPKLFIFSSPQKSNGLKLPPLLSQYLYQTKRLDLPGIGTFTLDASTVLPQESDRMGQVPATGIQFANANIPAADDALINFIKEQTGKMKSLAAADLDFYLTTGRQLLNIGKPFYLEGIGTLLKNNDGRLDFTRGEYLVPKLDDLHHPHPQKRSGAPAMGYDEAPREEPKNDNRRQSLLLIGIVAGIAIIAFGGYYLYKKNNYVEPPTENPARVVPEASTATDSTAAAGGKTNDSTTSSKKDTTVTTPTPAATAANPAPIVPHDIPHDVTAAPGQTLFHFVILRTENKSHALRRYNQLLGYQLNIHLETKDSSFFKLYFPIAATIRDTTRIRDSLADVYASRVSIEQH
jgi:hypothetical protein